ncbi:MAG: HNH endonuclease signature motif containing protein, partial [Bdellovibrionia bacterium]
DVPIAQESLVAGEVNLTTLSMAQVQIRHEEKITGEKVSAEKKATIVESIKNKTQAQVAVELFRQLPETATAPRNEERRISETETRLSHNFPDRVLKKLKRLREIWSHVDPNMDYVEIIERCADETLKRIDPTFNDVDSNPKLPELSSDKKLPQRLARHRLNGVSQNERPTESPNNFKRPTYYRKGIKNGIYSKAGACCEFVDPKTGNRCSSKFLLQIDHKIPIWAGGTNEPGNLQLLCSTHNRLKYAIETKQTFLSDRGKAYRVSGNYVLTG